MKLYIDQKTIPLTQAIKEQLKQRGYTLQTEASTDTEVMVSSQAKLLNDVKSYPKLQFVQLTSAGFDFIKIDSLKQQGIKIANAKGVYSQAIAEFVLARLLQVYQQLPLLSEIQQTKNYDKSIKLTSLNGLKCAILGTGSIASQIAHYLKIFEMDITGFNTNGRAVEGFNSCAPLSQFDNMAKDFDVVIITLPLNQATHHFFNKDRLLKIKQDGVLVNIARGAIINESDLMAVLDTHLAWVILDVFEEEPLSPESFLWHHPKTLLSPHISFNNNYSKSHMIELMLDNLNRFIKGIDLKNLL